MNTARLDQAIKAVCPISGVSIGRKDDKATWRIDFLAEAKQGQRTAAQAVLDAFDMNAPEPDQTMRQKLAALGITVAELKAELARP